MTNLCEKSGIYGWLVITEWWHSTICYPIFDSVVDILILLPTKWLTLTSTITSYAADLWRLMQHCMMILIYYVSYRHFYIVLLQQWNLELIWNKNIFKYLSNSFYENLFQIRLDYRLFLCSAFVGFIIFISFLPAKMAVQKFGKEVIFR